MTIGPGKYDDLATRIREDNDADAVVVVVINGIRGTGFSVQATGPALLALPQVFHDMSHAMQGDVEKLAEGSEHG